MRNITKNLFLGGLFLFLASTAFGEGSEGTSFLKLKNDLNLKSGKYLTHDGVTSKKPDKSVPFCKLKGKGTVYAGQTLRPDYEIKSSRHSQNFFLVGIDKAHSEFSVDCEPMSPNQAKGLLEKFFEFSFTKYGAEKDNPWSASSENLIGPPKAKASGDGSKKQHGN